MDLSIVIPAFDAGDTLDRCLRGVLAAMGPGDEVVVVDDGSRVSPRDIVTASVACAGTGADDRVRLVTLAVNRGRGPARNAGVAAARHRWVAFVDADVVPHRDAIDRLRQHLSEGSRIVFGSYDDHPSAPGVVSQYRNLLHHITHQLSGDRADHLFAGLAALDAEVLREVGGFDEGRWARDIEDVALGLRLVRAGHRIDVDPAIQGTHLKGFTVASMVRIDLVDRAIPWTRLILEERPDRNRFVSASHQMVSVSLAIGLVVSLVLALVRPIPGLALALLALIGFVVVNRRLFVAFRRLRGTTFAAATVPLHLVHVSIAGLGAVCGWWSWWRDPERRRRTDR